MNSKPIRVVIVGAGRIGAGFDRPGSKAILTHTHAFTKDRRTRLVGLVDENEEHARKEANVWGTRAYRTLKEAFDAEKPDVVVIATPDETHIPYIEEAASFGAKLIVCEKPILATREEIKHLREKTGTIPVIVNFSRRFDTTVCEIRDALRKGKYRNVITARSVYTGGLFHNGSHALDLARFFFGEPRDVAAGVPLHDRKDDPSIGGIARYEHCPEFHLMRSDARTFSLFEFEIVTEKYRIQFLDHGRSVSISEAIPDPEYTGFMSLRKARTRRTKLGACLPELVNHIVAVFKGEEEPRSSLENAAAVHEACELFAERARGA